MKTAAFSVLHRLPRALLPVLTAASVLAVAVPASLAEDAAPDQSTPAFTVPVPEGKLTLKEIHSIVSRAAIQRGWEIKEDSETKVVVHLLRHGHEATVTFAISEVSVEASWLGYKVDRSGKHTKPEPPTSWSGNLKKDVTNAIAGAAAGR